MHSQVAPIAWIYGINERLFQKALSGVSDEDAGKKVANGGNSLLFVAGHVTTSRYGLLNMLGDQTTNPWGDTFKRGQPHLSSTQYPPLGEVWASWNAVSAKLQERLGAVSEAELAAKAPYQFPVDDETLLGGIAFLAMHESFHIGQFSYIRKLLGYETLAG